MAMIIGLISALVSIGLPIVLVVWAVRQYGGRAGGRGIDGRSVRRFFQYALLYALMIVAASGVSSLLGLLVEEPAYAGDARTALARALTFTVFGLPMFVLVAWWTRRRLAQDADEAPSLGWAAYTTVASLTAVVVAMFATFDTVVAALDGRLDGPSLVEAVVWTGVWVAHLAVTRRLVDVDRREGQRVLGSLVGLGTSVAGLVMLLATALDALVVQEPGLVVGETRPLARAAATVVVGVPVWLVYWWRGLTGARRTQLWFGYVLLVGVGGSLVLAVVGASLAVYRVLVWFVGDPGSSDAARHFAGTPTAVACVVVGAASWWYHQQDLVAATPARTEVTRVYEYLMAGIALLAAAVGVARLVVALIEALVPPAAVEVGGSVVDSLLAAITLLAVGAPLWWSFWSRIGRATRAGGPDELGSPTRRVYLYVLFGVGGVTAVVSILVAAFIGFQGALEGGFDAQVVRDMRVPVAVLLTAGALSGYHWVVYRDDRSRLPAPEPHHGPRVVLLVGAPDDGIRRAVEHLTGARVDLWVRADGLAGPWVVDDVVAAVQRAGQVVGADSVVVTSGPDGFEGIGLRR